MLLVKIQADAPSLKFNEVMDKVLQAAAEPVDGPHRHHVELALGRRLEQGIEAGTLIAALGARRLVLADRHDPPAGALGFRLQFAQQAACRCSRKTYPIEEDEWILHAEKNWKCSRWSG